PPVCPCPVPPLPVPRLPLVPVPPLLVLGEFPFPCRLIPIQSVQTGQETTRGAPLVIDLQVLVLALFLLPHQMDGMETGGMGRPPTGGMGRPPTGMIHPAVVNRPITQQGLRAPTRAGTAGGKRQVLDKNYFVGILRMKANDLNMEINRLNKELEKGEKARMETAAYEKKAEEAALTLKKLHGRLLDYNSMLDKMHSTSELSVLEMEANDLKTKADQVAKSLEELFKEKKERDDEVNSLEEEIAMQKRKNQQTIAAMDPSIKDHYEELKEKSEALKELISEKENELSELVNLKNQLETDLLNSPLKQKAANLREELARLEREENELIEEEQNKESLDEKKAKLIQTVQKNNEEIVAMEKQFEQIKDQIDNAQEELHEFSANVESDNREQLERYQGLQVKEAEMNEFFATFEDQKRNLAMEMEELNDGTVQNLRRFSINLSKMNMSMQVNDLDPSILEMNEGATAHELKELHVRLEDELMSLNEMETRIHGEMEAFTFKGESMQEELDQMPDYNRMVETSQEESTNLEKKKDELRMLLPKMEESLSEIEAELDEITNELRGDDTVEMAESLTKKLDYLEETNQQLRDHIEEMESEGNYEQIKNEVLAFQKEYNLLLLNASRR
ncbi:hypothetical protein PENTCL1PPCAC_6342, partial [Pristionchus entomophagus]